MTISVHAKFYIRYLTLYYVSYNISILFKILISIERFWQTKFKLYISDFALDIFGLLKLQALLK
jgi:hypothetical protein